MTSTIIPTPKPATTLEHRLALAVADGLTGAVRSENARYQEFREEYRDRPDAFARECVRWRSGEGLADYQEEILAELVTTRRLAVRSLHGVGKTTVAALAILWFALTRDGEDWKCPSTASAWRQLREYLWPEVAKWARRLRWEVIGRDPHASGREILTMSIKLQTGTVFAVACTDPATIEGAHAEHLLYIFDEAKIIPDATWDSAEGAFMGAGEDTPAEALWLALSTPTDTDQPHGRFYDIHSRKRGYEDWTTRHITLDEAVAAGRVSTETVEQRRRQWGEESAVYQAKVLGNFPDAGTAGVMPLSSVEAAIERWHERQGERPPGVDVVGLDVADGGEVRSILAPRRGTFFNELEDVTQPESGRTLDMADLVAGYATKHAATVVVDAAGVGSGVYGQLVREGVRVVPFNGAEATDRKDAEGVLGFVNCRSAAWWGARERLHPETGDDVALPPDKEDKLIGDLTAPKWETVSGGRIRVEAKQQVKERLRRSTDYGDAVVMALWVDGGGAPLDESWMADAETVLGDVESLEF